MGINRRFMLKSLGFGTAAWILSPMRAAPVKANPSNPERFYIFCYFGGGWDTLISLDPRDPGVFTDSRLRETKIQLGYDRLPTPEFEPTLYQPSGSKIAFGPTMKNFAKHYDKSCVVRGIAMDTVSHDVGRKYFITGMMPRGQNAVGSSISTWLVAGQGELAPIPNLVVGVESYNRKSPAFASGLRVSGINGLLSTLRDGPQAPKDVIRDAIDEYRELNQNCDPGGNNEDGLMSLINTSMKSARVLVSRDLGRFFDFRRSENADISKRYKTNTGGGAQAAMAFQAIKNGIAQSISINLTGGLDTHGMNWATDQSRRQKQAWDALSVLVDDLAKTDHPQAEGKKLLDSTTIMCFSEFSRTPLLNGSGGRDHWLASSALLVGAGVPHNKVVGATTDKGFNPSAVNPITGEVDPAGEMVTPTRIAASLLESEGYDTTHYRTTGLPCLMDKKG